VTVSDANEISSTEKLLLRALIVSILLHMFIFSTWRIGQTRGWWRDMALPHWMQSLSKAIMPAPLRKLAVSPSSQSQLTFVEVDPALATTEPPKKPMFQGAKNTVAANPKIKELSVMPNIEGRQEKFLKTTENAKPITQPTPQPSPPQAAFQPQTAPRQNTSKQAYVPGDLTMARPSDKPEEGKSDADASDQAQPQPQPQQAYQKPRTIAEAQARRGIYGQQSRLVGGVRNVSPNVSLDVQGTLLGDYIAHMVDAIRSNWYRSLENMSADTSGKVVLRFRLHPNGSVTDMTRVQNEVTDLLATKCEQAISDSSPFEKWPRQMRLELPKDDYEITFTFYYEP